jgi:hypothetical protein
VRELPKSSAANWVMVDFDLAALYQVTTSALNQAVKRAVDECIREGILAEFLARNRNEVISMSIFEYDKELEEKKLRKAEYEYGFAEGEKHAAIEIAKRMLKTNNFSLEEIAAFSGVSLDDVKILKANQ